MYLHDQTNEASKGYKGGENSGVNWTPAFRMIIVEVIGAASFIAVLFIANDNTVSSESDQQHEVVIQILQKKRPAIFKILVIYHGLDQISTVDEMLSILQQERLQQTFISNLRDVRKWNNLGKETFTGVQV